MTKTKTVKWDSEYEIRICQCGHIHFIPHKKVATALRRHKELLLICGSCGEATRIGADEEPDFYDESNSGIIYNMYSQSLNPNRINDAISITPRSFKTISGIQKGFNEIFYSAGIKVPMMSGQYAQMYNFYGEYFLDIWFPDWYKIERADVTLEEVKSFIETSKTESQKVNMDRFVSETDDKYLQYLARTTIKAFDWTGHAPYDSIHQEYLKSIHMA